MGADQARYTPAQWQDEDTFHLGINMAGAVSAGAYTAGVLDFLMQALEQWHADKAASQPQVPLHKLSLDVFSGASAGGMCAAIASVMVQGSFEHIVDPADSSVRETSNRFYESWVNRIDIEPLLDDTDIDPNEPLTSLLDSKIIDQIAEYAIVPGAYTPRDYISKSLTLFLTLTNMRGTPFELQGDANGSAEEGVAYFADRLQFETVASEQDVPLAPLAKPLPLGSSKGAWSLLREAAKATGAFPLFLAPRVLKRDVSDYEYSPWQPVSVTHPCEVPPAWDLRETDTVKTLNVDGGLTDNDPFQLAHDFLAIHNPKALINEETGALENPRDALGANCAVITVAPFPSPRAYQSSFDFDKNSSIVGMLPNLLTVLISQSRFLGESLTAVLSGASVSRFVLAPSGPDTDPPSKSALQCSLLGAFGGFFERGFRAHDYQLGRRNCQKFLSDHFRLAELNPIMGAGMALLDEQTRAAVRERFIHHGRDGATLPIIPLCGTAIPEVPLPAAATISASRLNHVLCLIVGRLHAVSGQMVASTAGSGPQAWALRTALDALIATLGKAKLREYLQAELAEVLSD